MKEARNTHEQPADQRETLQTVHCIRRVIFNVFKDTDRELYEKLLKKG